MTFFVKSSGRSNAEMFEGESLGLEAMYACSAAGGGGDALRIPKVYKSGDFASGNGSFLIMEYLNLAGRSDDRALGKAMARMHLAEANEERGNAEKSFGFPLDNTIGEYDSLGACLAVPHWRTLRPGPRRSFPHPRRRRRRHQEVRLSQIPGQHRTVERRNGLSFSASLGLVINLISRATRIAPIYGKKISSPACTSSLKICLEIMRSSQAYCMEICGRAT